MRQSKVESRQFSGGAIVETVRRRSLASVAEVPREALLMEPSIVVLLLPLESHCWTGPEFYLDQTLPSGCPGDDVFTFCSHFLSGSAARCRSKQFFLARIRRMKSGSFTGTCSAKVMRINGRPQSTSGRSGLFELYLPEFGSVDILARPVCRSTYQQDSHLLSSQAGEECRQ